MGRRDGEGRQEGFRPIGPAQSQGAVEEKVWGQGEGAEGVAGPGREKGRSTGSFWPWRGGQMW